MQQLQKNSGHNAFCLKQYGLACYLSAHQIATRQPSAKHHLPKGTLCGLYKANFGTPIVKTQNITISNSEGRAWCSGRAYRL